MTTAIIERIVIKPGGIIEMQSPELPAGETAEVIVLLDPPAPEKIKLSEMRGAAKGGFASAEEADKFIRAERNAWER